jgi:hypothetical protein
MKVLRMVLILVAFVCFTLEAFAIRFLKRSTPVPEWFNLQAAGLALLSVSALIQ